MKIGSLFSGIGGLELGLERATGGRTVWQAESDPYARAVLERHWPGVRRYEDVRDIDERAARVDIICGGFPCQDISDAGKQAGIDGPKSGLWSEFERIIRVLRPPLVFIENVAALAVRGLDRVVADLAALGFDAEWDTVGACCVGAPHRRERLFILARHPHRQREPVVSVDGLKTSRLPRVAPDARRLDVLLDEQRQRDSNADADRNGAGGEVAYPDGRMRAQGRQPLARPDRHVGWEVEPHADRVADGVPDRAQRLRCLGNAVVPQQAELAWAILSARLDQAHTPRYRRVSGASP